MVPAFLFGVALVLAQLTSVRGDAGIGVLDIALVAAAVFAAATALLSGGRATSSNPALTHVSVLDRGLSATFSSPLALYALLSALTITVSYVLNAQRPAASLESLGSASVAFYAISLLILCMVIVLYSRHGRAMIIGFIVASLVLSVVYVVGFITQNAAMLYFDIRFTGFAQNPNQTALLALGTLLVLVISLLRFERGDRNVRRMIFATIPLTLIYGLATLSDAFLVTMPVFFTFAGLLLLDRLKIQRWVAVLAGFMLFSIFIVALAIMIPGLFGMLGSGIQDQLSSGSQDTDRQLLWRHGLQAFANSVWFGNGPGAWSGLGGPYQGMEAHNSIIDWLSVAGFAGLVPVIIVVSAFVRARPRFKLVRFVGFFALVVFAFFHFTFRLPIFWFAVAMLALPFFSSSDEIDDFDGAEDGSRVTKSSEQRPAAAA